MTNRRVYIAGPVHGSGRQADNTRRALGLAHYLAERGFVPFVPHLYLMWETAYHIAAQEFFLRMCMAWLETCHMLIRLPGVSPGSDAEVARARELGIPVLFADENTDLVPMHELQVASAESPVVTLDDLQKFMRDWIVKQPFGQNQHPHDPALGVIEEVGELREAFLDAMHVRSSHAARCVLKSKQMIRGTTSEHEAKMADAIGDITVYAVGFCNAGGTSFRRCVNAAVSEVTSRDWTKFPRNGRTE